MGCFHRDIKPENILFSQGHPIVADFGIAKAIATAGGANLTRTGFPLRTPGYMSPERAAGLADRTGSRGSRHRDAEVAVTVRGGRTRIIVQESLSNLIGGIGGGIGGGGMGLVMAILINGFGVPEAALPLVIPLWLGTTFAVARTSYHYAVKGRTRDLETLADRLAALARELAEPRPALRGPSRKLLEP